jgi:hypothetical protein
MWSPPVRLSIGVVLGLAVHGPVRAATCHSTGNGNWNNAATWSCGHVPVGGDSVIVLAGHTVSITQNHVYSGAPLQIQIFGVWYFSGGGSKVTLPCGSHVEIMPGGLLQPNSNSGGHSETVRICGTTYWYYDQGPQTGYQIWPPITLPVELLYFQTKALEGSALLTWSTATEHNAERFDLYRSRDGLEWESATSVPAQGNSLVTVLYSWFDTPPTDGLWYYRLVQVDTDGRSYEEGMVAVMLNSSRSGITCMPNPVTEYHLMITSSEPLAGARVDLVDMAQRYGGQPRPIWEEARLLMLDLSGLTPGVYLAQVTTADRSHHCTFVIQ